MDGLFYFDKTPASGMPHSSSFNFWTILPVGWERKPASSIRRPQNPLVVRFIRCCKINRTSVMGDPGAGRGSVHILLNQGRETFEPLKEYLRFCKTLSEKTLPIKREISARQTFNAFNH
jgi:hypothetical protein